MSHQELLSTYRFVRLAMPGLALLLALSVGIQVFSPQPDCWLGSISAYYYTPARAVFVASLCAIGTCLFVYRGTTLREDAILNLSGVLAFFVAFIPTPLADATTGAGTLCGRSNVPSDVQLQAALDNNIVSGLVALVAVAIAYWVFGGFLREGRGRPAAGSVVAAFVVAAVPVALYVARPERFEQLGHYVAAIGLFCGVIAMIVMHAWPERFAGRTSDGEKPHTEEKFQRIYACVIVVMALILAASLVMKLVLHLDNALFLLESGLIAAFTFFWSVQTWENWGVENAEAAATAAATPAPEDARR
ncbi:hypothetical protein C7S10_10375 [Nocardioides currus]|uniref:DUF998 domain-containing protein n=1 Tax=Nocardioides currus TaxID=2133958 RepID=A0A2R7YYE2_9ACTN|nr:hypothetical protein C7S10_10375 [Nocardioides currus]